MSKIEDNVEKIIKEKVKELGYELYDVEYSKEGKNYFLRIFIDKPEGIDLNDCEKVNDGINDLLDEANCIKESYFLEVSSPGIERILRKDEHLEKNKGSEIYIKLFQKDNYGKKEYYGILKNYTESEVTIETNEIINKEEIKKEITLERKNIAQIKTVYHWD